MYLVRYITETETDNLNSLLTEAGKEANITQLITYAVKVISAFNSS